MRYTILTNPRAKDLVVFDDDFEAVASYFSAIVDGHCWSALPGGVIDTYVPLAPSYVPLILTVNDFKGYRIDSGRNLATDKRTISRALEFVEDRALDESDFTLCPSVTLGLLVVLLTLRRHSVRTLIVELPGYFATIEQAEMFDIQTLLWPTVPSEMYGMSTDDLAYIRGMVSGPVAVLVTQPRYGMGYMRPTEYFMALRAELKAGDVLLVDEAADQVTPASLGKLDHAGVVPMIRIRGLTKGLGLNSARVAAIFHPREWRERITEILDYAGGTLDAGSLRMLLSVCTQPQEYADLLEAARNYVTSQCAKLGALLRGLPVRLSPMESGYIGTAHILLGQGGDDFQDRRRRFLDACKAEGMPVVLGSSMYFPHDLTTEIFRINYFTPPENLDRSAKAIARVLSRLNDQ